MPSGRSFFPPRPVPFVGRAGELRALEARIASERVDRLALIGGGGSGKSVLACAVGHRCRRQFPGGIHWFRVGNWDAWTLTEMLSRRLGVVGRGPEPLAEALRKRGRALVVLDNHENDRALARFLDNLRGTPTVWLVTARRCLLSGIEIFPVVPPLSTARQSAFPRVAPLTGLLRYHPLALDIADSLVRTRAGSVPQLQRWLLDHGVDRIAVLAHEDDVPEVRLVVEWAWQKLPVAARRMLIVLGSSEGDDIDGDSLAQLARVAPGRRTGKGRDRTAAAALLLLRRWHLVQEPLAGRFALHAVVREAVRRKGVVPQDRFFRHYVDLLERQPERTALEQTHLFAAMDHANRTSDLPAALRVDRLVAAIDAAETPA